MKKIAVRNLRLCTKDCLCLYVCPVGATDTENSIIDVTKCTGCGVCAEACPSKAISMVPLSYPPQQKKAENVVAAAISLRRPRRRRKRPRFRSRRAPAKTAWAAWLKAMAKSSRLVAEDILREAGYMLPQSGNAHDLLEKLIAQSSGRRIPRGCGQGTARTDSQQRCHGTKGDGKSGKVEMQGMRLYS